MAAPVSERLDTHPRDPQPRALHRAVETLRAGGLLLCPTDAGYALVWGLDARTAEERVTRLRRLDTRHPFTVLCASLSAASRLGRIDDRAFRLLRALTPGPVTFVLPVAPELPKRFKQARRKALGIRIPDHPVTRRLLETFEQPLMTSSVELPDEDTLYSHDAESVADALLRHVDLMLDAGDCPLGPTSIVDCTGPSIEILRQGFVPVEL